ncbi:serine/threonine-protein kinase 16-like [Clavelina lepadiformis]|uniref:non-specific serine/threonine protein kinase n=1 Tax=Clavelina lepadiformis TaxID=159417 RepID=A0ABP0F0L1_CLALP
MGGALSTVNACVCGRGLVTINQKRYLHQDNIGEGGFSYVDLIEDAKSGTFFALKRIICHDKKAENEALEEVEYCRMFHHENIIPLVDHCIKNKGRLTEVWLVLPYYKRGTLYDEYQRLATKNEKIPKDRVLSLFLGSCKGVEAFHNHQPEALAHRDIKPGNVLITNEDVPVLMDLGSVAPARVTIRNAKEAQALQDLAAERCTMPFRAPELFQVPLHCIIDEKVDIWSLGCILFSLMYLEGPFDQVWLKKDSVALAVQNRNLPFPQTDLYPATYRNLVRRLMDVEPATRPNISWVIEHVEALINDNT